MTDWQKIEYIFKEADKLKALEELYMERRNVTREQARQWALEKWNAAKPTPLLVVN